MMKITKRIILNKVLTAAVALSLATGYAAEDRPSIAETKAIAEEGFIYGLPIVMNYGVMYEYAGDKNSGQYKAPFNKPLEGSDDRTDLFIMAIYKIKAQLFNGKEDFETAARGFIGKPDALTIKNARGQPVWDLESYKAYISLDKPAVRDANDTMMKKQSQCKIWQAGNEGRILKRSHLCEHV